MITKLTETEAANLTAADVGQYLESTRKINVLYRNRSILEISACDERDAKTHPEAAYKVVYKDYEPLGCCDDWSIMGVQYFDLSQKDATVIYFLERLRNEPEECWECSAGK